MGEGGVCLEGFDLDVLDLFEVFAVVGQEGEVVVQGGATYEEVEVADLGFLELESAAFLSEESADLVVDSDYLQVAQKSEQVLFGVFGVSGSKYAVVQLGDGDHADGDAVVGISSQTIGDGFGSSKVMDCPIGID